MSVVTNVILKTSVGEDKSIECLNNEFQSGVRFVSCDDENLPAGWYAGSKMLECDIYPGSFNYLVEEDLIDAIKKIPWEYPECVQVLVQRQEEDLFTVIYPQEEK